MSDILMTERESLVIYEKINKKKKKKKKHYNIRSSTTSIFHCCSIYFDQITTLESMILKLFERIIITKHAGFEYIIV